MAPHLMLERAHYHCTVQLEKALHYVPRFNLLRLHAISPVPSVIRGPRPGQWGKQKIYSYHPTGNITDNGFFLEYGRVHRPGDMISFHVDTIRGTIEFSHNGKAQGVAYRNTALQLNFLPTKLMHVQDPGLIKVEENLQLKCYRLLLGKISHEQILHLLPPGMKNQLAPFEFLSKYSGKPFKRKEIPGAISIGSIVRNRNGTFTIRQPPNTNLNNAIPKSSTPTTNLLKVKTKRLARARKCPCCGQDKWCK